MDMISHANVQVTSLESFAKQVRRSMNKFVNSLCYNLSTSTPFQEQCAWKWVLAPSPHTLIASVIFVFKIS